MMISKIFIILIIFFKSNDFKTLPFFDSYIEEFNWSLKTEIILINIKFQLILKFN